MKIISLTFFVLVLFIASCNFGPDGGVTQNPITSSSSPTPPTIVNGAILSTDGSFSAGAERGSLWPSFAWSAASDATTPVDELQYQLCFSGPDPAAGSFSTLEQVSAGSCFPLGPNVTNTNIKPPQYGHAYIFNIIVTNNANLSAVYSPKGEFLDGALVDYYPLEVNGRDIIQGNHLSAASSVSSSPANLPTETTGPQGWSSTATLFDGSTQCLASNNPADSNVTGQNPRTFAFWLDPTGSGIMEAVSIGQTVMTGQYFGFYSNGSNWNVWLWGEDPPVDSSPASDTWHFWVETYSGGAGGGLVTTYMDGLPVAYEDNWVAKTIPNTDTTSPFRVGCGWDDISCSGRGCPPGLTHYYGGKISGLRVFDRVLCGGDDCQGSSASAPSEVLNFYNAVTATPTNVPSLTGEGIGYDSSSSAYTYTFAGMGECETSGSNSLSSETATFYFTNTDSVSVVMDSSIDVSSSIPVTCAGGNTCTASSAASLQLTDGCASETLSSGESCSLAFKLTDLNANTAGASDGGFTGQNINVYYAPQSRISRGEPYIHLVLNYSGGNTDQCLSGEKETVSQSWIDKLSSVKAIFNSLTVLQPEEPSPKLKL